MHIELRGFTRLDASERLQSLGGEPFAQSDDTGDEALEAACGSEPGYLCEWVFEATDGSDTLAKLTEWVIDRPLTILLILFVAWVVTRFSRRAIERTVRQVVSPDRAGVRRRMDAMGIDSQHIRVVFGVEDEAQLEARRDARAASITGVLASTTNIVVWAIALMMVLAELGLNLGPILAGAGIAGIALGFGAQSLVKDCISGVFMVVEDQYGMGDVVDLGEAVGVVEKVALRTTMLRGLDGTVWHVPNGEITRVGNKSQHWSTAVVDIDVAYDADLGAVRELMLATAADLCSSDEWTESVLADPEVLGVETLGADGITMRMIVQTAPGEQWALQRALREELKSALDAAEIEIPFPQRTLWLRNADS